MLTSTPQQHRVLLRHQQVPAVAAPRKRASVRERQTAATRSSHRRRSVAMAAVGSGSDTDMPAVVTPSWLHERLGAPSVRVLDASWYLPPMGRDAQAEHRAARIPGARFWDTDGVADLTSDLPHMMPSEAAFAAAADALGVANDDTVVIYDGLGLFSAPRAWWTWKAFGHKRVAVLEGGLPAWRAAGLPVDEQAPGDNELSAGAAAARAAAAAGGGAATKYRAKLDRGLVVGLDRMRAVVGGLSGGGEGAAAQVADARPAGRFKGADPEPRAGLRGGHMPGTKSVPFTQMYVDGQMAAARLKAPADLAAAFAAAGVDPSRPLVATCGSGLTAAVLALGAHQATGGAALPAVYDGSWCEWGALADTPVVTGDS